MSAGSDNKSLHIISLDVPYPPDYGGAVDIYYKLKSLHELGAKIYLHCFEYGRGKPKELEALCEAVNYYPRKTAIQKHFSPLPYIVQSRRDADLLDRLSHDEYPILMEGIHCSFPLLDKRLSGRKMLLRAHNVEHDYYQILARRESDFWKRTFYKREAKKLKAYLNRLPADTTIAAISKADRDFYKKSFRNSTWLPPFQGNRLLKTKEGLGDYALYHGNLSVSENEEAALMLIEQFEGKETPLKVAGKNPSPSLLKKVVASGNVEIVANPGLAMMGELIANAQVILLATNQATGIKLKLIESLYKGRWCVANEKMMRGTGLEELLVKCEDDFFGACKPLMSKAITSEDRAFRIERLNANYSDSFNATRIIDWLNGKKLE